MKTAKAWQDEWIGRWPIPVPQIEQIEAIQKDAYEAGLLRAAQIVDSMREDASGRGDLALHNAVHAIENESKHHDQ